MNLLSLIPAGIAIYSVVKSRNELNNKFNALENSVQAQTDVIREDVDKVINPAPTIIDKLEITPKAYFRSIVDKYWSTAFFVNIKNNSDYSISIRGIRMSVTINSINSPFMPYYLGNIDLQPGCSTGWLQLSGTYVKEFYTQKADRESVRKYLQGNGAHKMFCDIEVILKSAKNFKGSQSEVEGSVIYDKANRVDLPSGSFKAGAKGGNGASVEEFNHQYN